MEEIAGWVAPIATMLAAMMTAANLGARVTGWGFAVFLVGSIAWSTVGALSGQTNLLATNLFLCIVNMVGIWRWLGRQARLDDGARAATQKSEAAPTPALFSAALLSDRPLKGPDGTTIGQAVGAMAERGSGAISYVVVREGGVAGLGERFHKLGWDAIEVDGDRLATRLTPDALRALPELAPDDWPGRA